MDYLQDFLDIEEYKEKRIFYYKIKDEILPDYIPSMPRKT